MAFYQTDYKALPLDDNRAVVLLARDYIQQRSGSADYATSIMARARAIEHELKCEWLGVDSGPQYFWLGIEAEGL